MALVPTTGSTPTPGQHGDAKSNETSCKFLKRKFHFQTTLHRHRIHRRDLARLSTVAFLAASLLFLTIALRAPAEMGRKSKVKRNGGGTTTTTSQQAVVADAFVLVPAQVLFRSNPTNSEVFATSTTTKALVSTDKTLAAPQNVSDLTENSTIRRSRRPLSKRRQKKCENRQQDNDVAEKVKPSRIGGSKSSSVKGEQSIGEKPSTSTSQPVIASQELPPVAETGGDEAPGEDNSENDSSAVVSKDLMVSGVWQKFEGNYPDVNWRAIPMDDLRQHPRFVPLSALGPTSLASCEDVRYFRQDSWQWQALHDGRCTTSQTAAALGFFEPIAGQVLDVPPAWRRNRSRAAYERLRQSTNLRTLDGMNSILCNATGRIAPNGQETNDECAIQTWSESNDSNKEAREEGASWFAAQYCRADDPQLRQRRREEMKRLVDAGLVGASSIRMAWGNTQEPTSLLTALNYFSAQDPKFMMKEVGMCGAGLAMNHTKSATSSLLVGASPDAVLCHSDGTVEALEVKNHCPFFVPFLKAPSPSRSGNNKPKKKKGKGKKQQLGTKSRKQKQFAAYDRSSWYESRKGKLFASYIPQLQMEMYCLDCPSAVLLRQTATKGAYLVRVYRNNAWIQDMLFFLNMFCLEFVDQEKPPPSNFFWSNPDNPVDQERYRNFVNRTLELTNTNVDVIGYIPNSQIQRGGSEEMPLFLD